jgi:hypothetical protein
MVKSERTNNDVENITQKLKMEQHEHHSDVGYIVLLF